MKAALKKIINNQASISILWKSVDKIMKPQHCRPLQYIILVYQSKLPELNRFSIHTGFTAAPRGPLPGRSKLLLILSGFLWLLLHPACENKKKPPVQQLVKSPEELQEKTTDLIRRYLQYAEKNEGRINDTLVLFSPATVKNLYEQNGFHPLWGENRQWLPLADSLYFFITHAKLYGLFPEDYFFTPLTHIRSGFANDSLLKGDRMDAALWARADVMMTGALLHIIKDIKLGRLPADSVTLRKDSVLTGEFYYEQLLALQQSGSLHQVISNLEPRHKGYHQLKAGIKHFLGNARFREFTKVPSPKDTAFKAALQKRLFEEGYIEYDSVRADSATLAEAVKKFQKKAGIHVDGKAGEVTVRMLNTTDRERQVRIAITLDRYKLLPEKMPARYLWVNLPGYYLHLVENDSVKLYSKIICGKPHTRSPVLNASITELITYPQWTIPQSIIVKEILPVLKKNPGYLAKKGYTLLNNKSEEVDPYTVDWSKYKKGIPYRIIQGSGDANALGVMKFNFSNPYAIYLHDTNQRSLFAYEDRAMSHGCIRVQNWENLAFDILRHDNPGSAAKEDSVRTWLNHKQRRSITVRNRLPLFIRYFTCEGKNGEIIFYDDIYGEDKMLREIYFSGK